MNASSANNDEIVKLLLANKAEVNYVDNDGRTALMYASLTDALFIIDLLIFNNARIDIQDKYGDTALSLNLKYSECDYISVEQLIKYNSNIFIKNNDDISPIEMIKDKKEIYENKNLKPTINKIEGVEYFKEVFREYAEDYIDIFNTTLYSQDLELDDIKANIDMFYSTIVLRMENNSINENVEL